MQNGSLIMLRSVVGSGVTDAGVFKFVLVLQWIGTVTASRNHRSTGLVHNRQSSKEQYNYNDVLVPEMPSTPSQQKEDLCELP